MTIDKPSPMLTQLQIDQFARPFRFVRILNLIIIAIWIKHFGNFLVDTLTGNFSDSLLDLFWVSMLAVPAWVVLANYRCDIDSN